MEQRRERAARKSGGRSSCVLETGLAAVLRPDRTKLVTLKKKNHSDREIYRKSISLREIKRERRYWRSALLCLQSIDRNAFDYLVFEIESLIISNTCDLLGSIESMNYTCFYYYFIVH